MQIKVEINYLLRSLKDMSDSLNSPLQNEGTDVEK